MNAPRETPPDLEARPLAEQAIRELAEQTAEAAAERAAIKAIQMTFLYLGVDITDKDQVAELKDALGFALRTNRGARLIKNTTIKTCVGAVVTGALAMLILGFKDTIASWFR